MANIARAPFYIPRPADDPSWSGGPVAANVLRILSANKFRASKQWQTLQDDPQAWSWSPPRTETLFILSANKFRASKQWPYTQDDPALWWPFDNQDLPLLVSLTKAPFHPYPWPTVYDSDAWQPTSARNLPVLATPFRPVIQYFTLDDSGSWISSPERNQPLLQVTPKPFFAGVWAYNLDDSGTWQWAPAKPSVPPITTVPSGSFHAVGNDDPAPWSRTYVLNRNLTTPQPKPSVPHFWNYNPDDASSWQWVPSNPSALQLTPYAIPATYIYTYSDDNLWRSGPRASATPPTVGKPLIPGLWNFNLVDEATWQWHPPSTAVPPITIVPGSAFYASSNNDPSGWSGLIYTSNRSLNTATANPFFNLRLSNILTLDDGAFWQGQPRISNPGLIPTFTPSPAKAWTGFSIPEDNIWNLSSKYSASLYIPIPAASTLIQRTLTGVGL